MAIAENWKTVDFLRIRIRIVNRFILFTWKSKHITNRYQKIKKIFVWLPRNCRKTKEKKKNQYLWKREGNGKVSKEVFVWERNSRKERRRTWSLQRRSSLRFPWGSTRSNREKITQWVSVTRFAVKKIVLLYNYKFTICLWVEKYRCCGI